MRPTGTIYLCSNVPLTNSYEHTIDFTNPQEQFNYFGPKVERVVEKTQYVKKGQVISVSFPLDEIKGINYLYYRATNSSKYYFCFVNSKHYVNDHTTDLEVELDVLQTYMFDYKINPSYIAREHVDRWNTTLDPIFSVTDEGLDYGSDYVTEKAYKVDSKTIEWIICVLKTGDTLKYSSDHNYNVTGGALNGYITCLIPFRMRDVKNRSSAFYNFQDSRSGERVRVLDIQDVMYKMMTTSFGESVVELTYCPYLPFRQIGGESDGILTFSGNPDLFGVYSTTGDFDMIGVSYFDKNVTLTTFDYLYGLTRPKQADWDKVKANPLRHTFDRKFESKLLCYPYRYNLLSNWKDNPVIFKNEHLPKKCEIKMSKAFGFNAPCRYWIDNYMLEEIGRSHSVIESASVDFPVMNNEYASYMYNNKNTLKQNKVNQAINIGESILNGAMTGGKVGAITGAIGGGISAYQNLASENAKQKDIGRLPNSYINSEDSIFTLTDDNKYLTFYRYRITQKDQDRLAWYWHMFGYKSGAIKIPDLRSRNRFNFIQTIGANITGNFDQEDITKIKNIFDKGVTFWHYHSTNFYPMDYRYGNYETSLLD